jgi:hypothetical protein
MCQHNETRCFKSKKPKKVFKIIGKKGSRMVSLYRTYRYEAIGKTNLPTNIQISDSTYSDQPGYHCFLSLADAKKYGVHSGEAIVSCTIPPGELYRYGAFFGFRTLRATNIIIDSVIKKGGHNA